jgi:hypothetical protein
MPSKYLKCPNCSKTPDYQKVKAILYDAINERKLRRPFSPEDPVIVSETEVYCCAECYITAVIREEIR